MKKLILILIFLSFISFSQDYENSQIRVKFTANSDILKNLKNNSSDPLLSKLIGEYKVSQFIDNKLEFAYQKALAKKRNNNLLSNSSFNNSLKNIYTIEYSNSIDPHIAARKLASSNEVEFAEVVFKREIVFTPNDPMASEQYHHDLIKTYEAWDLLDTTKKVVIAIVDTGIEFEHSDLKDNIWYNQGEMGLDANNNPKQSNGIDDDENGYVDDFQGWDMALDDNDPRPGHKHGTHVGGLAAAKSNNNNGGAGVAYNGKLLAVKVAPDSRNATNVVNSYQGLLYAAIMGADVINCSWGGGGFSDAEASIVKAAVDLGSVIVCAAGNNGSLQAFYPSSYDDVLSVASTDNTDSQSSFSNYHPKVDVSAPGSNILSSVLDNTYANSSGTSMASPIAAGVVGMIKTNFPQYNNIQVMEHLKATTDNIEDNLVSSRKNNFGTGRINALKALSTPSPQLVRLESYQIIDLDGDNVLEPGDEITIKMLISNHLNDIYGLSFEVASLDKDGKPTIAADGIIGDLKIGNFKDIEFNYILPDKLAYDANYQLPVKLYNSMAYESYENINFTVNQSYRNYLGNKLAFTINSRGNIGFNDYPSNEQGIGFQYEGDNVLFEGGILVGNSQIQLANSTRSNIQMQQDFDFQIKEIIREQNFEDVYKFKSTFSDLGPFKKIGVEIEKTSYYIIEEYLEKAIIVEHKIRNKSGFDLDSLFLGYFFDWDIGMSGQSDVSYWDQTNKIMIQQNENDPKKAKVALGILSNQSSHGFAIDNDGETEENPGVYNGFTAEEKWNILSGKITRLMSNTGDVSSVISAGPMQMKQDDSTNVTMIIMASDDIKDFPLILDKAKKKLSDLKVLSVNENDENLIVYPNPVSNDFINYELVNYDNYLITIEMYDVFGTKIITKESLVNQGYYYGAENISSLSNGTYFLKITTPNGEMIQKFIVNR